MHTEKGTALTSVLIVIVLVVLLGGGYYVYQRNQSNLERQTQNENTQSPEGGSIVGDEKIIGEEDIFIDLTAQNNSEQDGIAEIYDNDQGIATVKISLFDAPEDVSQPAHIHLGSCAPKVGAVKYPLTNVVNAESETTLTISTAELLKQLPLAINVHKSTSEAGVYISCGNITVEPTLE